MTAKERRPFLRYQLRDPLAGSVAPFNPNMTGGEFWKNADLVAMLGRYFNILDEKRLTASTAFAGPDIIYKIYLLENDGCEVLRVRWPVCRLFVDRRYFNDAVGHPVFHRLDVHSLAQRNENITKALRCIRPRLCKYERNPDIEPADHTVDNFTIGKGDNFRLENRPVLMPLVKFDNGKWSFKPLGGPP